MRFILIVNVSLSEPSGKEGNAQLTKIPLKPLRVCLVQRYVCFNLSKPACWVVYTVQSHIKLTVPLKYSGELEQFVHSHIGPIQVCVGTGLPKVYLVYGGPSTL